MTLTGESASSSNPFSFTEEFDNQNYRSALTTADWNGGVIKAKSPIELTDRITNPLFNNFASGWTPSFNGIGSVQDGGKCPWASNYACWGWKYTQVYGGSYSKISQAVDLTGVDYVTFTYLNGGTYDPTIPNTMSFFVDGDRLWNYAPQNPSLRYGDTVKVSIGNRPERIQ